MLRERSHALDNLRFELLVVGGQKKPRHELALRIAVARTAQRLRVPFDGVDEPGWRDDGGVYCDDRCG